MNNNYGWKIIHRWFVDDGNTDWTTDSTISINVLSLSINADLKFINLAYGTNSIPNLIIKKKYYVEVHFRKTSLCATVEI